MVSTRHRSAYSASLTYDGSQQGGATIRILIANSNRGHGANNVDRRTWFEAARNLGHMLIGDSLHDLLSPDHEIDEVQNIWDESAWTGDERLQEEGVYDRVVLSLQDLLRGGISQPLFNYEAVARFAEQVRAPLIVVGLGANTLFETPRQLVEAMPRHVRWAIDVLCDRAEAIGVRGEYSAEVLQHTGVVKAQVIGCPTFFHHAKAVAASDFAITRDAFAYGGMYIPQPFDTARDYFVLQDELPALHELAPECFSREDAEKWLSVDPGWLTPIMDSLRPVARSGRALAFASADAWSRFLADNVGAVVGGRLHGGVAALSHGIPLLLTNPDLRTREFAEYMKFPYRPNLPTDTPRERLAELIDMGPFKANYGEAVANFRSFFVNVGVELNLT